MKNLREAVNMAKRCAAARDDFERHRDANVIYQWKMIKRRWELDPSQPDPYRIVEKGETFVQHIQSFLTSGCYSFELQCCEA